MDTLRIFLEIGSKILKRIKICLSVKNKNVLTVGLMILIMTSFLMKPLYVTICILKAEIALPFFDLTK